MSYCVIPEGTEEGRAQPHTGDLYSVTQEMTKSLHLLVLLDSVRVVTLHYIQKFHNYRVLIGMFCNLEKQERNGREAPEKMFNISFDPMQYHTKAEAYIAKVHRRHGVRTYHRGLYMQSTV
jgi:hypothetical protein